ncbi:MAG: hypothetical protein JWP71_2580 [Mucilaginibacter sp.]|nr:hypothetical protein [Mucilaginibacter sp.]
MALAFKKLFRINLNKKRLIMKQLAYPTGIVTVCTLKKVMCSVSQINETLF